MAIEQNGCCRFCGKPLQHIFADLGATPNAASFVRDQRYERELLIPLRTYVCEHCKLVQVEEMETPENIFSEYAYFSSISKNWLAHCRSYCEQMRQAYSIDSKKFVVEIASNDGYLLHNFKEWGTRVLGVEPAKNVAQKAVEKQIDTICEFFGSRIANIVKESHGQADLIVANNVLAHTPTLNDFVQGLRVLLAPEGIITLEFPHLLQLILNCEFDTIYHEHYSYFSILMLERLFYEHDLKIFNVEKLPTHGGSLRVYCCHKNSKRVPGVSVPTILREEREFGLDRMDIYMSFQSRVEKIKRDTLSYLIQQKNLGKQVVAFGAPAKGSTFLNYCGIGRDMISYTVDETPYKQGLFMPGVRIPIFPIDKLYQDKPDIVVILPWNWKDEILGKLTFIRESGGKIVTFIPRVQEF